MLERRTGQAGAFVTEARIVYPGDRHHLVGRFSPAAQGSLTGGSS
jgi:GntR family transcriptional regulator, histidine utilization repressor